MSCILLDNLQNLLSKNVKLHGLLNSLLSNPKFYGYLFYNVWGDYITIIEMTKKSK